MPEKRNKKELGRGIRALLANMDDESEKNLQSISRELSKNVAEIPINWIEANPQQPRTEFDQSAIDSLAASIRVHGIIQPLTLRRLNENSYQIIAGERRYRAAQIAGLEAVPAYVRVADDQQLLEMALVENIQREDLNALEVAISMNRLIRECTLTHDELSTRLGKERSTVTNYLRLLKLPPEIQQAVRDKQISMGHARALAGIEDLAEQLHIFRKVISEQLSVRKLEALIKSRGEPRDRKETKSSELSPELRRIRDNLSGVFGARVALDRNAKGKGKITIHFNDDEGLNHILDLIENIE